MPMPPGPCSRSWPRTWPWPIPACRSRRSTSSIASAVHFVVFIDVVDGVRRLASVREVVDADGAAHRVERGLRHGPVGLGGARLSVPVRRRLALLEEHGFDPALLDADRTAAHEHAGGLRSRWWLGRGLLLVVCRAARSARCFLRPSQGVPAASPDDRSAWPWWSRRCGLVAVVGAHRMDGGGVSSPRGRSWPGTGPAAVRAPSRRDRERSKRSRRGRRCCATRWPPPAGSSRPSRRAHPSRRRPSSRRSPAWPAASTTSDWPTRCAPSPTTSTTPPATSSPPASSRPPSTRHVSSAHCSRNSRRVRAPRRRCGRGSGQGELGPEPRCASSPPASASSPLGLFVFDRAYLTPYGSAAGQVALIAIGGACSPAR